MRFMHCEVMHYEIVYCIPIVRDLGSRAKEQSSSPSYMGQMALMDSSGMHAGQSRDTSPGKRGLGGAAMAPAN
jgi:hypothetical protein